MWTYIQASLRLSLSDVLIMWRDVFLFTAWVVIIIYLISGTQDFIYDLWIYTWRITRRIRFKKREKLSLARLRLRDQQRIALFIPAWQEADVIDTMVKNILKKVEYERYIVFIGTYPNDPETQNAVDRISEIHPQVKKVVTSNPGPTNKADCLNHIYLFLKEYEILHNIFFEIIVMHDAEDFVHPYSFLLYNFLIPRVDAIQLPILPLSTGHWQWVHWIYADEFSENHMKDVIVRERMKGFVPYAGVGTGFSRRMFNYLDKIKNGEIFNQSSLTEDYSTARSARSAGLTSIFVNVVLADDKSPWYTPFNKREFFIANWAYFPFDFKRSIKQKTRWILGISLQEWEQSRWEGNLAMKENFLKDRKGIFAFSANLLGYCIFLYSLIYIAGQKGIVPFQWEPIFYSGTALFTLIVIASFFMVVRMTQRIICVSTVYGIIPGLLSVPRLLLGNIINGIASFRALKIYIKTLNQTTLKWDKTAHHEGAGVNPLFIDSNKEEAIPVSHEKFISLLQEGDISRILGEVDKLEDKHTEDEYRQIKEIIGRLRATESLQTKVLTAKIFAKFGFKDFIPLVKKLLFDSEWLVRANAAKAFVQSSFLKNIIQEVFMSGDKLAMDVMIKTLEQNEWRFYELMGELKKEEMKETREKIFKASKYLAEKYKKEITIVADT